MKSSFNAKESKSFTFTGIPATIDVDYFERPSREYAMLMIDVKAIDSMEALIRESFKLITSEARKVTTDRVELFGIGEKQSVCVNCFIGGEERFDMNVMSSMACAFTAIAAPYCVGYANIDITALYDRVKKFAEENNTFGKLEGYWQHYCSSMGR